MVEYISTSDLASEFVKLKKDRDKLFEKYREAKEKDTPDRRIAALEKLNGKPVADLMEKGGYWNEEKLQPRRKQRLQQWGLSSHSRPIPSDDPIMTPLNDLREQAKQWQASLESLSEKLATDLKSAKEQKQQQPRMGEEYQPLLSDAEPIYYESESQHPLGGSSAGNWNPPQPTQGTMPPPKPSNVRHFDQLGKRHQHRHGRKPG